MADTSSPLKIPYPVVVKDGHHNFKALSHIVSSSFVASVLICLSLKWKF